MFKKTLILTLVFYLLVLGQTSFLVHFKMAAEIPFILILAIILNFFGKTKDYSDVFAAFAAGFFLDIFSPGFVGFYASILLAAAVLIKIMLKKYVWAVR